VLLRVIPEPREPLLGALGERLAHRSPTARVMVCGMCRRVAIWCSWPLSQLGPAFPPLNFQRQGGEALLGGAWLACATSRDLLGAHEDRGRREVQGGGQLVDIGEGHVALAALDPAVVATIEAAYEREPFLRYAAFFAQFAQCFPERSVDRGDRGHAGESVRRTAIMPLVIRSIDR